MITATRTNQHCRAGILIRSRAIHGHRRCRNISEANHTLARYQLIRWLGDIVLFADVAFLARCGAWPDLDFLDGLSSKRWTQRKRGQAASKRDEFHTRNQPHAPASVEILKPCGSGMSTIVVPLVCECFGGCLLEIASHNTSVAVRKIRTLHHQDIANTLDWINPRLGAPRSPMAKCAWRKHCRYAFVR